MLTVVKLADVNGQPKFKFDLPDHLKVGDPIRFPAFRIHRTSTGRREVLEVESRVFQTTALGYDSSTHQPTRHLSVEVAEGSPPTWRSVKKAAGGRRRLPPAVFPRTPI